MKRNYLISEEIAYIVSEMLKKDTILERELVKLALTAQFVMEEHTFDELNSCNEICDYLFDKGIDLYEQITNLYLVDKIIDGETSVAKTVEALAIWAIRKVEELEKNVDNMNREELINQLKELQNNESVQK